MPEISVIIPIYNCAAYLRDCLDSIRTQSFTNIEIILVNDGSTDNSLEIAKEYEKADKRLRVISTDNHGVSHARNIGLKISEGKYICFVDADDFIDNKFLKIAKDSIESSNADIFMSGIFRYKEKSIVDTKVINERINKKSIKLTSKEFLDLLDNTYISSCCGNLYKKSVINNSFDETLVFGEDLKFVFELLLTNVVVVAEPYAGYYYRNNTSSVTTTASMTKLESCISIYEYLFKYAQLFEFDVKEKYYEYIRKRWINDYLILLFQVLRVKNGIKKIRMLKILNSNVQLNGELKKSNDKFIIRYGMHPILLICYQKYKKFKEKK